MEGRGKRHSTLPRPLFCGQLRIHKQRRYIVLISIYYYFMIQNSAAGTHERSSMHESAEVFNLRNTVELAKNIVFDESTQIEPRGLFLKLNQQIEAARLYPNIDDLLAEAENLLALLPESSMNNAIAMVRQAGKDKNIAGRQKWYQYAKELLDWWQQDFMKAETATRMGQRLEDAINGNGI